MIDDLKLKLYQTSDLPITKRSLERKIGEDILTLETKKVFDLNYTLTSAYEAGIRYVLLGIPEDIGPMANCGRGGADGGWQAFLSKFLNMQSNRFFNSGDILLLGHIVLDDLLEQSRKLENMDILDLDKLRILCAEIDNRVYPVIKSIVSARLKPIVIGGGHNNAYPIIKGTSDGLQGLGDIASGGIASINCDPHLDFRPLEGRHSGNPFSYAFEDGKLVVYGCCGIHESYNSEEMLNRIDLINKEKERIRYVTYEKLLKEEQSFTQLVNEIISFIFSFNRPIGLEFDLDSILGMPVSAVTPSGISVEAARIYVQTVAKQVKTSYLHLAEGAPSQSADGNNIVGKTLAYLVTDYIKSDKIRIV